MNFKRLGKQFRRELKSHPKKAALLALLVAVGFYYWAPVVSGWFAPKKMSTANPSARSIVTAPVLGAPASGSAPVIPWQDLVEAMKRDPLKAPAENVVNWRDPFRPSAQQVAIVEQERRLRESLPKTGAGKGGSAGKGTVAAALELTPATAGLSVTSTLVSSTQRMALIKGNFVEEDRVVRQLIVSEGTRIRVLAAGGHDVSAVAIARKSAKPSEKAGDSQGEAAALKSAAASFRVVRISPRTVTLEYRGREYELSLAKPKLAGNLKIRKAAVRE